VRPDAPPQDGEDALERRLAAILAADIVGYSRLMRADEEGTLARLKALRAELFDPQVAEHHGRIVKTTGDGALVEFASAVDAVRCAVAVQADLDAREPGLPDDAAMALRIGINLGDVIVEDGDIYGDGVNLAARLEGLAETGGICLSANVHEQVRHKLDLAFEDMGEHSVKNISEPVRVYRVVPGAGRSAPREPSLPEKPSIAVLPFDNMSGDPEQDYLADGISEDLITALSKIRWFFVIARNSTFTYKGQAVDVTKVAKDLRVRYVIEGSVRKAGNRVRITAQLIDATTGKHVWAERYDRDLADIFELQDEMTQTIVGAVEPELGVAERERALSKPPENMDAWETYQRGLWHLWRFDREDNAKALQLLGRAHELDPGFTAAYAHEAYSHYINVVMSWSEDPDQTLAAGMTAAKKALALDDRDAVAFFAAGRLHMMLGEHDASIAALETSLALNPSFAQAYHGLAFALTLAGRLDDALDGFHNAERLSPRDPLLWAFTVTHALACILSRDYDSAVQWAHKTMQIPRASGYWPHAVLAAALAHLDRMEEARAAIAAALDAVPDLSLAYLKKTLPTKEPDGLEPYLDGLRKAGLPE
jgi:adenylate cyclase